MCNRNSGAPLLTQVAGLVDLGFDVHMVLPYYDRNRKGETGYAEKDGIKHMMNIHVQIAHGEVAVVGIHTG